MTEVKRLPAKSRGQRLFEVASSVLAGGLIGAAALVLCWRYFAPPIQIPFLALSSFKGEYCPIPLTTVDGRIDPPECRLSTSHPHLICDCSRTPKKERPVFVKLINDLKRMPPKNDLKMVPPILPGDPPSPLLNQDIKEEVAANP